MRPRNDVLFRFRGMMVYSRPGGAHLEANVGHAKEAVLVQVSAKADNDLADGTPMLVGWQTPPHRLAVEVFAVMVVGRPEVLLE